MRYLSSRIIGSSRRGQPAGVRRQKRPTIVVVSHICPFPAVHGNRTRLLALLHWLRQAGYSITFILQPLDVEEKSGLSHLAELVDRLEVSKPYGRATCAVRRVRRICSRFARAVMPRPLVAALRRSVPKSVLESPTVAKDTWGSGDVGGDGHIDRWCWVSTCRIVQRAVRRDRPLAVLTEYALLSKCLLDLPGSPLKVIDTVEVFFRNRERFNAEGLAAPFVCTSDSEQTALSRANVLIAIQENDARSLRALFPATRVITVSHTYPQQSRQPGRLVPGTILYVGSSNPFNVHGLRLFLDEAWGAIVARIPGATLRIVGSVPPVPGPHLERVIYVGRVSDQELAAEYQDAHVVINPQIAGTGLKIKCVEALSAGCALVMNSAGADGLEAGAGSAFLLAQNWSDFAGHVVRLLLDDPYRLSIEAGANRFAAKLFSQESVFSDLAAVLQDRIHEQSAETAARARLS
jgi:glycosyltransferase involved in cell wall biosynthesis